jgi:hypothetical protein
MVKFITTKRKDKSLDVEKYWEIRETLKRKPKEIKKKSFATIDIERRHRFVFKKKERE